ncbi:Fructose-bisphosphate aldolase class 2 [Buchnera aphidicola (Pterocallis alni)]|uniref:class II fructose-bisphosphate aldolase n=1 Tax=Buchnera aphidicola TaxID=9 RepID=UPI003463E1B3
MSKIQNSIQNGIIFGKETKKIFKIAKKKKFAIPAVNCTNIDTINIALETASKMHAPIIIQLSYGGSSFISGNNLPTISQNKKAALGSLSAANHINLVAKYYNIPVILHTDHCYKDTLPWIDYLLKKSEIYFHNTGKTIFSSHMIDLSKEKIQKNLEISKKYLLRMSKINMILEIELGCTGGEEDGIDNSNIKSDLLYTKPEEVYYMYHELKKISNNFIIAANFGNTHGVYAPGNVQLKPNILKKTQQYICNKYNLNVNNPVDFVFHGGSGSSISDIKKSINYGVVKINIDTDIQWASWEGILKYYQNNKKNLQTQLSNINGINIPNKKYYDPRSWIQESKKSISEKLKKIFTICNCYNLI